MGLILIIVGFIIFLHLMAPSQNRVTKTPFCKLHKWEYKDRADGGQYMQCKVCNYISGTYDGET